MNLSRLLKHFMGCWQAQAPPEPTPEIVALQEKASAYQALDEELSGEIRQAQTIHQATSRRVQRVATLRHNSDKNTRDALSDLVEEMARGRNEGSA